MHHPSSSLIVIGHSLKKCAKLSRLLVSLSRILQNVQLGETVLSLAFNLLFSDRPLLRNRYRNCRMSLWSQELFQSPIHFLSVVMSGTGQFVRAEYMLTVRSKLGLERRVSPASRITRNFLEPFLTLFKKTLTGSDRFSESSGFLSLCLDSRRALWIRNHVAGLNSIPINLKSAIFLTVPALKQSLNFSFGSGIGAGPMQPKNSESNRS